ncbi:hypothetical protein [Caudoviricetes sp.]|nr:hypothetical protein [Caudoviricetes sp.]
MVTLAGQNTEPTWNGKAQCSLQRPTVASRGHMTTAA